MALRKGDIKENTVNELIIIAYYMGVESVDKSHGIAADRWGLMKWRGIKR